MAKFVPPPGLAALVDEVVPGARLLRSWPLAGGVSASVIAVEYTVGGQPGRLVVRRYGPRDLAARPDAALVEQRVLLLLRARGLPVPAPCLADPGGRLLGAALLVTSFVEGTGHEAASDRRAAAQDLAELLARLHGLQWVEGELAFLPAERDRVARWLADAPTRPDAALDEAEVRAALMRRWPPEPPAAQVLLHGDAWPGNVLWAKSGCTLVDWEDAARGDARYDLGVSRLEIAMLWGWRAVQAFTGRYRLLRPSLDPRSLPLWDLVAVLRSAGRLEQWGLGAADLRRMRRARRAFAARALAALDRGDS